MYLSLALRAILALTLFCTSLNRLFAENTQTIEDYKNTDLDFKKRAQDLVARMSLDEKIPQLINDAPAIPRLGVREYNWWNEGLHGVAALGEATVFPQAIGMAATWDEQLMLDASSVIGDEFRAKHYANQHRFGGSGWFAGLTVWSPNLNIFRDPRWGRGQETYGEDPYLTSRLGVAYIKGIQTNEGKYLKTVATPKHFAVHSGPEATRHQDDFHPSKKDLEETYLPAFYSAIAEAKAQSIMCAYNAVDGIPACANQKLLKDTLVDHWGFDGFVVSDCGAVYDVYHKNNHGYSSTPEEAIKAVLDAGLDLICGDATEANHIKSAINKGLVSEERIDESLIRLFTARMALGQFDPRERVFPDITPANNDTPAHRAVSLEMAKKSLVLLKNEANVLPLSNKLGKLAVIGPNADSVDALVGNYNGMPSKPITVLKGLIDQFGASKVRYSQGVELVNPLQERVASEYFCIDRLCEQPGLVLQHFASKDLKNIIHETVTDDVHLNWQGKIASGAARWRGFIRTPETGQYSFRYSGNGGYRIWIDGKLVIDAWAVDWRPVIASGKIELEKEKIVSIKIESFQRGDAGDEHLVWSKPSNPGARAALALAQSADAIIFVGGLTAQVEGEEMPVPLPGFVGGDRTDMRLPSDQRVLLNKLYQLDKPLVLILLNGSPLAITEDHQRASAIVEAWYPGGEGGQAIAELLAGKFSPAGRLPLTFYRSVDQLPAFTDYSMQNRTYKYFTGDVLYPFGYGLSYTQFKYSDLNISPKVWKGEKKVTISASVKNVGTMQGEEVVQLYITHNDYKDTPIRSLIGFKRVYIPLGETKNISFQLEEQLLSIVEPSGGRKIKPGDITVWIGGGQPIDQQGLEKASGLEGSFTIDFVKDLRTFNSVGKK